MVNVPKRYNIELQRQTFHSLCSQLLDLSDEDVVLDNSGNCMIMGDYVQQYPIYGDC